jgi:uncharacterized membrane protein
MIKKNYIEIKCNNGESLMENDEINKSEYDINNNNIDKDSIITYYNNANKSIYNINKFNNKINFILYFIFFFFFFEYLLLFVC